MFTKLQLVMLGVVVLQGASLNAMDKGKSPRNPLSCSQEARKTESGDFAVIAAIKRPREASKEGANIYYDSPCGAGRARVYEAVYARGVSPMAPWVPEYDYYPR